MNFRNVCKYILYILLKYLEQYNQEQYLLHKTQKMRNSKYKTNFE